MKIDYLLYFFTSLFAIIMLELTEIDFLIIITFVVIISFLFVLFNVILLNYFFKKAVINNNYDLNLLLKSIKKYALSSLKPMYLINLSYLYGEREKYDEAILILSEITPKKLQKKIKISYYNNLIWFNYKSGNVSNAKELLVMHKAILEEGLSDILLNKAISNTIEKVEKN